MKKNKELFLVIVIVLLRIVFSSLFSDMLYPDTNNIIESMLIDLSPYILVGVGIGVYNFILKKLENIVKEI